MRAVVAICCVLALTACASQETRWVGKQREKCAAMGGTGNYDADNKLFECWRHPVARHTKKLFEQFYLPY